MTQLTENHIASKNMNTAVKVTLLEWNQYSVYGKNTIFIECKHEKGNATMCLQITQGKGIKLNYDGTRVRGLVGPQDFALEQDFASQLDYGKCGFPLEYIMKLPGHTTLEAVVHEATHVGQHFTEGFKKLNGEITRAEEMELEAYVTGRLVPQILKIVKIKYE